MKPIGVVTSVPTDPPGTGTAASSLRVSSATAVEIQGLVSAGTGSLKLLRWRPTIGSGTWCRYLPDRPLAAASGSHGGEFSGRYELGVCGPVDLLLLNDTSLTVTRAHAEGVDYR